MTIEIFATSEFTTLANPSVSSLQLLWPGNSPDARLTITRVTVAPGAAQARHSRVESEQIWIIEQGGANLLLAGDESRVVSAGQLVRTPARRRSRTEQ